MGLGHYARAGSVSLFDGLASFSFGWRLFCPICTFFARFVPFFPIFVAGAAGVLLPFNQ